MMEGKVKMRWRSPMQNVCEGKTEAKRNAQAVYLLATSKNKVTVLYVFVPQTATITGLHQIVSNTKVKYPVATRVEIKGHEDGFLWSYYAARVLRHGNDKYLVKYEELIDDHGEKVEDWIAIQHIRPYPPKVPYIVDEGDDVDVFDNDGWWRGTVILARPTDVMVYFDYMKKKNERQKLYKRVDVRIHQRCFNLHGCSAWVPMKVDP
ncbi:hypothetical protein LXL04_003642 [Taraxacum kok-saghyz]